MPRERQDKFGPPTDTDMKAWEKQARDVMSGNEYLYKGKDLSNQFTLAMNQILRRFIHEVRGGNIAPVFPSEEGGYKLRSDQMTAWSQLLGTVEKMKKTRDMIEGEEQKGKIDSSGKLDNVKLFQEATQALKDAKSSGKK